jgi:hypothetical protein
MSFAAKLFVMLIEALPFVNVAVAGSIGVNVPLASTIRVIGISRTV